MAKKYFIWKNPECNGVRPEWLELSGKKFYEFMTRPENRNRHFVILTNRVCNEADILTLEANKVEFIKWVKERNHEQYIDRIAENYTVISLSDYVDAESGLTFCDVVSDDEDNIDTFIDKTLEKKIAFDILSFLTDSENETVQELYVRNKGLNESKIALKLKIPQKTLNNRKLKIRKELKKIKKNLAKIDF